MSFKKGQKKGQIAKRLCAGSSIAALSILGWSSAAHAQSTPAPQAGEVASPADTQNAPSGDDQISQEIVVTGFRNSLTKALNIKKDSAVAVDSILAEDIGKFPDLNLSESIQRIPGVAISRDGGEGRSVSVRGLGPQFTRVRINGMEALATAGGSDASGGTNRGRGFDFNVFASDLFNQISVRKTAESSVEEGSLGATVDLRTARPFDTDKDFTLAASAQGSYNDLANTVSPRVSALVSKKFADGTLGVLASFAYQKRNIIEQGYGTVRWAQGNSFAPGFQSVDGVQCAATPSACTAVNTALHPRFPRYELFQDDEQRLGGTLSLQWKPSDRTLVSLDGLYADFKATRMETYLEAPSLSAAGACTAATRPTTCGIADIDVVNPTITNGVLTKGTFNDVDLRTENRFDRLDTTFKQATLDVSQQFGDRVTLHLLGGYSSSKHKNPVQNTLSFDLYNTQGFSYDFSDSRHPVFNWGATDISNPANWKLTQIRLRQQFATNDFKEAQGDLNWKVNDEFEIAVGASYRDYDYISVENRRSNGSTSNLESQIPAGIASVPITSYGTTNSFQGVTWFGPSERAGETSLSLLDPTAYNGAFALGPEPALGNNVSVSEKDTAGYLQTNWHHDFGGLTIRGNAGIRFVETHQTAQGFAVAAGTVTPIVTDRTYDDWLPSANLILEPSDKLLFRLGAARVMARPDLGSLPPGASVTVSGSSRSVSVGNPNLDPYRASAYDASVEWYFQPGALLSVALFQKNISSFVTTQVVNGTFTGNPFDIPDSVAVAACGSVPNCSPDLNNWQFSTPTNTQGGRLRGFEINYQQPLTFLPSFLHNTGLLLNFTDVTSKINYPGVAQKMDLTGLSHYSANGTLYYEDKRISTRISIAYRSKYLTQVPGREVGTDVDGTDSTVNVDASFQYTLTKNFKLTLEAINITNQPQNLYDDSRDLLNTYHYTGREFLF
ncbi:MAG: TonB-dependent receptor, partial [Sphingomonas sp.]